MELATFATIVGLLELVVGIPMLVSSTATTTFILKLVKNEVFMRTVGAVSIAVTVLVLQNGYTIGTDAAGLIRLVAWLGLIKGVLAAWWPKVLASQTQSILGNSSLSSLFGIVALVVGGLLLWGAGLV